MDPKTNISLPNLKTHHKWLWPAYLGTLAVLGFLMFKGAEATGYQWAWDKVPATFFDFERSRPGPLLKGLMMTAEITALALVLTTAIGLLTAVGRLFGGVAVKFLAALYLEFIRNTPLMVQIFVIYFVLGPIIDLPRFWAAVLALSLFEGAYLSEIIRSGILAVSVGQWQASWCLGLSPYQTMRHVVLPQTGPMLTPPLISLAISLLKDSALVSTIALADLVMQAQNVIAEQYLAFEIWFTVALIYLVLALAISWLGSKIEKRIAI